MEKRQKERPRESGALSQNLHPTSNLTAEMLTAYLPPFYGFLQGYFGRMCPWKSKVKGTLRLEHTGGTFSQGPRRCRLPFTSAGPFICQSLCPGPSGAGVTQVTLARRD